MNEKDINRQYEKNYLCILIIEYLSRLIELYWKTSHSLNETDKSKQKINRSLLITGIYDQLLETIINGKINDYCLKKFIGSYVDIHTNLKNRQFPRNCI